MASIGHWWEDETEPDMEQEISMLASDFSDINVGSNAEDTDQTEESTDTGAGRGTTESDDDAQLGTLFSEPDL